jgi:S-adenosylmethionine:tRNA ribosyltransferase-isomerase
VPPYIHRETDDPRRDADRSRYQTVYAAVTGAVAAPTAGLHLTVEALAALSEAGVPHAFVTLHVGPGTFRPVKTERVEDHRMDAERYELPAATAAAISACRKGGGRVVAVGSTTVRTLETVAAEQGEIVASSGRSALFIRPPYTFRAVDVMLTNFHLPRSTLLMMVSALAGRERVMAAYEAAVAARYRFFSYGDCMLIL